LRLRRTRLIEFLDKEMFTELTEGERRESDLVVKARLAGQAAFFVIHLEHQAPPMQGRQA
jgi:hypothetical protein